MYYNFFFKSHLKCAERRRVDRRSFLVEHTELLFFQQETHAHTYKYIVHTRKKKVIRHIMTRTICGRRAMNNGSTFFWIVIFFSFTQLSIFQANFRDCCLCTVYSIYVMSCHPALAKKNNKIIQQIVIKCMLHFVI